MFICVDNLPLSPVIYFFIPVALTSVLSFVLQVGPMAKLCMGMEPAFYVDAEPPTFAFNPCGHMATEKTVK
jgi:hypothetical protein